MRKFFTFLCAALMSVGMWALTPKSGDTWDETTKTLTVNSNPEDIAYWGESDIENLVISDAVTSIGVSAFEECSALTSVTIGNNVESIGESAFSSCYLLTSVEIPNSVEEIGVQAFASCSELTSVTIGNGVTSIGDYAFVDCSGLETVTINADSLESYGTDAFEGTAEDLTIYVPAGSVDTYKAGWSAYAAKIVAIPAPTPVGPVADLSKNIAIDLRGNQLGGDGSTGGSKYLIIDSEDNYTYVDDEPAAYNAYFAFDNFNGTQHGYTNLFVTAPVEAGNYLLTLGGCQFGTGTGNVKNASSEILVEFDQKTAACYNGNPAQNTVSMIFTVDAAQTITIDCGNWTPYIALKKMPEIPAFTDFTINFMSDSYTVTEGTLPAGTVIDGTPNTDQTAHGYQNVVATVPVKAGTYRLTLGTCQYGTGTGNVMSETNIELASFDQKTAACYHQNPAKNIISMIFDVDQDQHITIDCGNYTPYMKLEKISAYHVVFALDGAEGTAPAAADVTIGEALTMPVNKTMYKAGYTLTGWSDGVNTYAIGESFTPANDVVLTPVFTANEADLLNASSDVTVEWDFGGDNGAPSMILQGATGLLVAQATIGDKTVDVKLAIDATSTDSKFAPQPTTEWANVQVGTIFTYPYKEGMTVNVGTYSGNVTYYIEDGNVTCGKNDLYSFIKVTYPASQPTAVENVQSDKVQATKFFRDGQLLIEKNGKTYNIIGTMIQ